MYTVHSVLRLPVSSCQPLLSTQSQVHKFRSDIARRTFLIHVAFGLLLLFLPAGTQVTTCLGIRCSYILCIRLYHTNCTLYTSFTIVFPALIISLTLFCLNLSSIKIPADLRHKSISTSRTLFSDSLLNCHIS